jgi:predicted RND superfamily exporter protein
MHDEAPESRVLPSSGALIAEYLLFLGGGEREAELLHFLDFDYRAARVNVNFRVIREHEMRALAGRIGEHVRNELGPEFTVSVAGVPLEIMAVNDDLVASQLVSMGVGVLLVILTVAGAFRSLTLGLLSIVPTSLPVIGIFGLMGWAGIGLSIGTVMIAPLAIGVGVDYAVHFLSRYGAARRDGEDDEVAVRGVLASKGRAALLSTVVLCVAFGLQVLSAFKPIAYFGWLSVAAILIAFAANFVLLPALIIQLGMLRGQRSASKVPGVAGDLEVAHGPV